MSNRSNLILNWPNWARKVPIAASAERCAGSCKFSSAVATPSGTRRRSSCKSLDLPMPPTPESDGSEELVADVVAVGVVDGFEPVEVDEDEGEALPLDDPSGVAGGQAGAVEDP